MEMQLQELIEQIKKNGAEAAEGQAAEILKSAKAEAETIIAEAKAEAEKLISDAKNQNERMVKVSEDAIRQAGRNLLITFRESVTKELNAVIGEQVASTYSSSAMSELIMKVVEAWTKNAGSDDISVILNEKDAALLESSLLSALKERALKGVTLKPNNDFDGGFRICINSDGAYYDYSAEAVTEMLSAYLNPKVTSLMKETK